MNKRIYSLIGLTNRARKVVYGVDNIVGLMKTKKISIVIISSNSSINTQKLIQDKAKTYNTKVIVVNEIDELTISKALGKDNVMVIGVKDKGFRNLFVKELHG